MFRLFELEVINPEDAQPYDIVHRDRIKSIIEAQLTREELLELMERNRPTCKASQAMAYDFTLSVLKDDTLYQQRTDERKGNYWHQYVEYELYTQYIFENYPVVKDYYPKRHPRLYGSPLYELFLSKLFRIAEYYAPERVEDWLMYCEITKYDSNYIYHGRCREVDFIDIDELSIIYHWLLHDEKSKDYYLLDGDWGTAGRKVDEARIRGRQANISNAARQRERIIQIATEIRYSNHTLSVNSLAERVKKHWGAGSPSISTITNAIKNL